ncbi:MAG: S9 family peptidase [Myxococcota bacterium]
MLAMDRISGHEVSPDGKTIVFVRRVTDLEADKGRTDLWTVPVAGGAPTRLTTAPASDTAPHFSPDGTAILFLSSRGGSMQVWRVPTAGGEATQVTDLPLPVGNLVVGPAGKHLVVSMDVAVDCPDLACTKKRLDDDEADGRSGRVYDGGFVRHWDTYGDGRRSHLFALAADGKGTPVDLMAGMDADAPSKPFGGTEDVAISPDGQTVVFSARDVGTQEPWSTNFDLFSVPITGGKPTKITDNPAWDAHPVFSADGTTLFYAAMRRPGYEADRFVIQTMAWPSGPPKPLTQGWDRSARAIVPDPDGKTLWVTAQDLGQVALFAVSASDGTVRRVAADGTISGPAPTADAVVVSRHDLASPAELFSVPKAGGEATAITTINAAKVAAATAGAYEQFSFKGAKGDTVYGYIVHPAAPKGGVKYPIAFLIHGGPQGSFGNKFHYRWNPQAYAGAGYASVMIDFHGSTGYGQAFTDAINRDWGGAPLEDLQKGLAAAIEKYEVLDGERVCALGASYGGFMINWIAGNWPDRFDCLVNHDGVFDQRSMYYATEELWFPEWEQGGPYYDVAAQYEKHNPARFVKQWKTPMLVIHGSRDYRVPEEQGLAAFNALQRQGIESRYLHFPDENHWVLSANNSLLWHETVIGWLDAHTKPAAK